MLNTPIVLSSGHCLEVVTNAILCYHSNVHEKMYSDLKNYEHS